MFVVFRDCKSNSSNNSKIAIGTSPNTSYWGRITRELLEMLLRRGRIEQILLARARAHGCGSPSWCDQPSAPTRRHVAARTLSPSIAPGKIRRWESLSRNKQMARRNASLARWLAARHIPEGVHSLIFMRASTSVGSSPPTPNTAPPLSPPFPSPAASTTTKKIFRGS